MSESVIQGQIFTLDPGNPVAEAAWIRNGKVAALGRAADMRARASKGARVISLGDRYVLPGFTDSHCHLVKRGLTLNWVDLNGLSSLEQCKNKLAAAVRQASAGQWIVGFGWNENLWQEDRLPHKRDLDDIAPDNPVMATRVCLHSVWVNSAALDACGIHGKTPPTAGRPDRPGSRDPDAHRHHPGSPVPDRRPYA